MLEQLKYKNHVNEVFEFGKAGIYVDSNDLRDYSWDTVTKGNRIVSLSRSGKKRKLPVTIICDTEEKGIAARNRLFEVVEQDVLAMKHGQIIIGGYYFKCFVTGNKKSEYLTTKKHMKLELTLTTDFPYWVKESKFVFRKNAGGDAPFLDYSFDYPFDYYTSTGSESVNNTDFVGSNFRMFIYGACLNPTVNISGHLYQVNCQVADGEYLTIDSVTKTITLTAVNGQVTNKFNYRNKESYIFEKIKPGNNAITWGGNYGIDLILLEERSEPKWT